MQVKAKWSKHESLDRMGRQHVQWTALIGTFFAVADFDGWEVINGGDSFVQTNNVDVVDNMLAAEECIRAEARELLKLLG